MTKHKRKKMFIDPVVQGALLRRIMLHWVYFVIGSFFTIITLQVMVHGVDKSFAYHVSQVWEQYGILALVIGCFLPAFIYDSIKLSHRFAGPIYKLRLTLKDMANGQDPGELKFRKSDYWGEIAIDINRINERLRQAKPASDAVEEGNEEQLLETVS